MLTMLWLMAFIYSSTSRPVFNTPRNPQIPPPKVIYVPGRLWSKVDTDAKYRQLLVLFLYGCLGSSIAWCCESVGVWDSENPSDRLTLFGSDCVAINGVGVIRGQTGPIVP